MKALLFVLATTFLFGFSCRKGKNDHTNGTVVGKWKLALVTGGLVGLHMTAAEWGHSQSFTFGTDGKCTSVFDGNATNGTYSLNVETLPGGNKKYHLDIKDQAHYLYAFAHDTLVLSVANISDATADWYVRE